MPTSYPPSSPTDTNIVLFSANPTPHFVFLTRLSKVKFSAPMWQRCTCSLPKSSRATSSERRFAAERAPKGATLINLAHFLRDVRETKRGRHFITGKGSLWSAFSTSCLNMEGEMALIMFWGMFGFGEMVSSISFMGDGGGWLCWRACLLRAESTTLKCFTVENNGP